MADRSTADVAWEGVRRHSDVCELPKGGSNGFQVAFGIFSLGVLAALNGHAFDISHVPLPFGASSCWGVAKIARGIVKICTSAPATAPRASSATVESREDAPGGFRVARHFMHDVYARE